MKNTKLIQLLRTFSPAEFSEFGRFVNSPFHNQSTKMIRLYNSLKKYYPAFEFKDFKKENIYSILYADEEFNDKKFRDRCSDMMKLAEDYITYNNLKNDQVGFKNRTLNEFSSRGLPVHFDKKLKEIKGMLDSVKVKNEINLYNEYLLNSSELGFSENKQLLGKRKSFFEGLEDNREYFLRYFVTIMLRTYSIMNNVRSFMDIDFEYSFYEPVMKYLDENNLEKYPLIKAFQLMLKLNKNYEDSELYYNLKKIYTENYEGLDIYDKTMISTELYIHANRRKLREIPGFDSELFEIVKLQLEHETYPVENGWMAREQFIVCVDAAVSAGELAWAKNFIHFYSPKVVPAVREDAYKWAMGLLYYSEGKYDLALKELSRIKTADYIYYFAVKIPISKIYFELGEFENVLTVIDSFKHYISSNNLIPEKKKESFSNYINVLHRLTLLAQKKDDFKITKLVNEIKGFLKVDLTANKIWLLEKALELQTA